MTDTKPQIQDQINTKEDRYPNKQTNEETNNNKFYTTTRPIIIKLLETKDEEKS